MRKALDALVARHRLGPGAGLQIERILEALAAEPDPHTSVSEPQAALEVHVADSLSGLEVSDLVRARRIADMGAGAGFPGLVLAVALPQAQVDLVESAGRKTAVVDRLIQAGEVSNARSITTRAEELGGVPAAAGGGREAYDAVT
ncbi:MAG TPA: RsmG family class I SAM-dependent methyltransferase, partial [Kofleriaceae bacterium]|nr:RsmG family class I SAM-dependent methyltransferase [Kofleriaceae bacterium]